MSSRKRENGSASAQQAQEREYRRLCRQLAGLGYIMKGSLQTRRTSCGYPRCRCRKGGRFGHGPYYWWTSKIGGKTVTVVLTLEEGKLFSAWVTNRKRLDRTVEKMHRVSAQVARAKLGRPPPWFRRT